MDKLDQKETFFSQINPKFVPREEFVAKVAASFPGVDPDLCPALNFAGEGGQVEVWIRNDIFPEKYVPYILEHERWEAWVARKPGFNLYTAAIRSYRDKITSVLRESDDDTWGKRGRAEFHATLRSYSFEFRHEFAIWREYLLADKDSILDEYHQWVLSFNAGDRERALVADDQHTIGAIDNDTKIRESIYSKIRTGSKHSFTTDLIE